MRPKHPEQVLPFAHEAEAEGYGGVGESVVFSGQDQPDVILRMEPELPKTLQGLLKFLDQFTDMPQSATGLHRSDLWLRIKQYLECMIVLSCKVFGAAFMWELVADIFYPQGHINNPGRRFVEYSVVTGAGAGAGIVPDMYLGVGVAKVCLGGERILTRRNAVQAGQLALGVFLTDSLWAGAYRVSALMWGAGTAARVFSGVPLFALGPWFILMSQLISRFSVGTGLVRSENSFNPRWANTDLWTGVGLAAIGFALAGDIDGGWGLSMLADCLLSGVGAGVGAAVPYLLLLVILLPMLCLSRDKQPQPDLEQPADSVSGSEEGREEYKSLLGPNGLPPVRSADELKI